ncbi:MAG TPA: chemotaxis protein CheW, partial [Thermoanaerobaculia bacterium]|nr:chemotaxis protein CheW [Thermoanaerobaculia bacterium]
MVNLAKIRKKAKEQKQEPEAAKKTRKKGAPADAESAGGEALPSAPVAAAVSETASPRRPSSEPAGDTALERLERFKRDAGKDLGEREFAGLEEEDDQSVLELLTFILADEHYAVEIDRIVEIIQPRRARRVPNSDEHIVGLISLR